MKAWWLQLNQREQHLVSSLGAVFVVFLLYSLIWQPLNENIEKGQQKLARQQSLLAWVNSETARFNAAKGSSSRRTSSGSLSSVINRSASSNNITITRVQPQGTDIQVWIDNIAFTQLLNWLEHLSTSEGVFVKAIDLTSGDESGLVRVKRLQLGKG